MYSKHIVVIKDHQPKNIPITINGLPGKSSKGSRVYLSFIKNYIKLIQCYRNTS